MLEKEDWFIKEFLYFTVNNLEIVMTNDSGEIFGVLPSKELWRININDTGKVCQLMINTLLIKDNEEKYRILHCKPLFIIFLQSR